jgi:peptidase MA superfamily protein
MRLVAALWIAVCALALPVAATAGRGADGEFDRRTSSHFDLQQDVAIDESGGFYGSRRFEQQVLAELERAYDELDHWLGLRPQRKISVVIYDPGRFDAAFAGLFRFPAAGFYEGVIRVRGDTGLTEHLARVLHHELVHAALDAAAPTLWLPGWVNEGAAEWFETRTAGQRSLSEGQRAALAQIARAGELHSVTALATPSFAGMGARPAAIAYLESYALIDFLVRSEGERSLSNFIGQLIQSRNLDRALRRVFRFDSGELQARFVRELT